VPVAALVSVGDLGLTSLALGEAELAAIRVYVEDVLVGAVGTPRGRLESNWEDIATEETKGVREGAWLEPHRLSRVVLLICLEKLGVHRVQILLVHVSWEKEHWVSGWVRREWLIERVVANDEWVFGEAG